MIFTKLMSDEPLGGQERFERPHGDGCDCSECLRAWTKLVVARYISVCWPEEIPGTDLVILADVRISRQIRIWKRADYLTHLKHLAVVKLRPYERLKGSGIAPVKVMTV